MSFGVYTVSWTLQHDTWGHAWLLVTLPPPKLCSPSVYRTAGSVNKEYPSLFFYPSLVCTSSLQNQREWAARSEVENAVFCRDKGDSCVEGIILKCDTKMGENSWRKDSCGTFTSIVLYNTSVKCNTKAKVWLSCMHVRSLSSLLNLNIQWLVSVLAKVLHINLCFSWPYHFRGSPVSLG